MNKGCGAWLRRVARAAFAVRWLGALLLAMAVWPAHAQLFLNVNKSFNPINVNVGGTSLMVITLANTSPDTSATLVSGTDTLPSSLAYNAVQGTTCSIAPVIGTPYVGGGTLTWSGGIVPPSSTCTIQVVVTPIAPGTLVNTIPPANVSGQLATTTLSGFSTASATITAGGTFFGVTGTKSRSNSHIHGNGTQSFTITLNNPNGIPLNGVGYTDTLPTGLRVAVPGGIASNSCGGATVNTTGGAVADGDLGFRLSGGSIAANGSCSVTVVVRPTSTTGYNNGNVTNSVAANNVTTTLGVTNAAALTQAITLQTGARVLKSFTPSTIVIGGTSLLQITIENHNLVAIAPITLTDTFPADVSGVSLAGIGTGCGTGATANVSGTSLILTSGTATAATNPNASSVGQCTITAVVTSGGPAGAKNNTIAAGTFTGGFVYAAAAATLTVNNAAAPVGGSKAFSPGSVVQGGTSLLTITLTNSSAGPATGAAFTDNLSTMGGSITVAASPAASTTCAGGVVTAPFGASSFSLSGATIPATGNCTVSVPVAVADNATSGVRTNSIAAGSVTSSLGTNSAVITAALTVLADVTVTKAFSPATVPQTGSSVLTITLQNGDGGAAASITSFADNLNTMGPGITIGPAPAVLSTCGGSLTATPGTTTISQTGGSIPDGGSCQIIVPVVVAASVTAGAKNNTIAAGALVTSEGATSVAHVAALTVSNAMGLAKAFVPATVGAGEVAQLTITVTHTLGAAAFTGLRLTDTLPALHTVATPANVFNNCGGTVTANPGSSTIALAGGGLPAGATSCIIQVDVLAPAGGGTGNNSIGAGTVVTDQGVSNPAAANASLVRVVTTTPVTLNKDFTPANINAGSASVLRVLIVNPNTFALTSVALTDAMPAGMIVAPVPSASTTCAGGSVAATAGASSFSLSGGTVPARAGVVDGTCSFQVRVTSFVGGNSINSLPASTLTSAQGVTNNNNPTATLQVLFNLNIDKAFTPTVTQAGQSVSLTVIVYNSNTTTVAGSNPSLTDNLPAGLELANGGFTNNCGGTVTDGAGGALNAGDTSFQLRNGTFTPGSQCQFSVSVRTVTPLATGTFVNSIAAGALATAGGTNPVGASATATFIASPLIAKSFNPASIIPGALSTLTFTLTNPNTVALTPVGLTSAAFTDTLPAGASIYAPGPATGTCAGVGGNNFGAGATTLPFSGLTIPAAGTCSVIVSVTAPAVGAYLNTVTGLVSSQTPIASSSTGSATLTVLSSPSVSKSFTPNAVLSGGTGTAVLTIVLTNPNATPAALASPGFIDVFPTSPSQMTYSATLSNSCGGTLVDSANGTLAAGDVGIRLNGGTIPAAGSCSVSVVVYMPGSGTYLNNMPSVTTTNAGSSASGATASVSVSPATQVDVTKTNGVTALASGSTTAYTITISNLGPASASGAVVTDPAVAGLACMSVTCTAQGTGASCLAATPGDLANLQGPGFTLGTFPAGSHMILVVACTVTATGM